MILVDERPRLGGEIISELCSDNSAKEWLKSSVADLNVFRKEHSDRFTVLCNSTAYAWHDQNFVEILETITTAQSLADREIQTPRKINHKVRAKEVILATGAHERPMLFEANDLSNIMLSQSVRRYLNEFGVISGNNTIIYGNNDTIYQTAKDLIANDISCMVIDVRPDGANNPFAEELENSSIKILQGYAVVKAHGSNRVKSVDIAPATYKDSDWEVGNEIESLNCDLLATSGGFNPVVHLNCHSGSKTYFNEDSQSFLTGDLPSNRQVCGAVDGTGDWQDAIVDGRNKAKLTLQSLGINKKS